MRRRHNPPRRHPVIEIGLAEQNGASGRFKEGRAVTLPHLIPEVARGQAAIGRRSLLVIQLRSAEIEYLGQNAVSSNAGQRNALPMHLYIPHPHFAVQRSSPLMTEDDCLRGCPKAPPRAVVCIQCERATIPQTAVRCQTVTFPPPPCTPDRTKT